MTDDNASQDAVVIERSSMPPWSSSGKCGPSPATSRPGTGPTAPPSPVAKMDVCVGGTRLVCMEVQGQDGPMQMWFTGEYREVIENERLLYTESIADDSGNVVSPSDLGMPEEHPTTTEVRVQMEAVGRRTRMVITHAGLADDSPGAAGWAMALDKLAAHVETHSDQ